MTGHAATVEVLTAKVRVLMVGSRQVTLSVYRQLDEIPLLAMEAFGRVRAEPRPDDDEPRRIQVVGASRDGQLCASWLWRSLNRMIYTDPGGRFANAGHGEQEWERLSDLPLIVLAGLR